MVHISTYLLTTGLALINLGLASTLALPGTLALPATLVIQVLANLQVADLLTWR